MTILDKINSNRLIVGRLKLIHRDLALLSVGATIITKDSTSFREQVKELGTGINQEFVQHVSKWFRSNMVISAPQIEYVNKSFVSVVDTLDKNLNTLENLILNRGLKDKPLNYFVNNLDKVVSHSFPFRINDQMINGNVVGNIFNFYKLEIQLAIEIYSTDSQHLKDKYNIEKYNLLEIKSESDTHVNFDQSMMLLNQWKKVFNSVNRLVKSNEECHIISLERGSVVLLLGVPAAIIYATLLIINEALKTVKSYRDIEKVTLEIKKMRKSDLLDVVDTLVDRAKNGIENESQEAADKLIDKFNYQSEDKNEVRNSLKLAIKFIASFVLKKGKIDVKLVQEMSANDLDTFELGETVNQKSTELFEAFMSDNEVTGDSKYRKLLLQELEK